MKGKREFCPGDKCKNAWKYANRTGKLDKKENQKKAESKNGTDHGKYPTILGQLTKVTTTADQCVRIQVDMPVESVKLNMIEYLNHSVVVAFIEDGNDEKKESAEENSKDRFFN